MKKEISGSIAAGWLLKGSVKKVIENAAAATGVQVTTTTHFGLLGRTVRFDVTGDNASVARFKGNCKAAATRRFGN